jgi:hypothetical protein
MGKGKKLKEKKEASVEKGRGLLVPDFWKYGEEVRAILARGIHTYTSEQIRAIADALSKGIRRTLDYFSSEISLNIPVVSGVVHHCLHTAFSEVDSLNARKAYPEAKALMDAICSFCDNMAASLEHIFILLMVIFFPPLFFFFFFLLFFFVRY